MCVLASNLSATYNPIWHASHFFKTCSLPSLFYLSKKISVLLVAQAKFLGPIPMSSLPLTVYTKPIRFVFDLSLTTASNLYSFSTLNLQTWTSVMTSLVTIIQSCPTKAVFQAVVILYPFGSKLSKWLLFKVPKKLTLTPFLSSHNPHFLQLFSPFTP